MERYVSRLAPGPRKTYANHQISRLREAETELCQKSALVLAIQDIEQNIMQEMAPDVPIRMLPVGIDRANYRRTSLPDPPRRSAVREFRVAAQWGWSPCLPRGGVATRQKGAPRGKIENGGERSRSRSRCARSLHGSRGDRLRRVDGPGIYQLQPARGASLVGGRSPGQDRRGLYCQGFLSFLPLSGPKEWVSSRVNTTSNPMKAPEWGAWYSIC